MKCPKPAKGIYQTFPCGQCIACRINKKRIWSGRIVQEWLYHPVQSYFCTLTYNPASLAKPWITNETGQSCGSLDKQAFRQWLKDSYRPGSKGSVGSFRYYAVGEYGDKSRRAHYHLAVFPEHPAQLLGLKARWEEYGFFHYSPINHARASYLADYVTKRLTPSKGPLDGAEPEFRISSRNPPLGSAFVEAVIAQYQNLRGQALISERGDVDRTFRVDGKIYPFGEWALRKIRKGLGIPLLHRERLAHPRYAEFFPQEDPEWDEEMAKHIEVKYGEKTKNQRRLAKPYLSI